MLNLYSQSILFFNTINVSLSEHAIEVIKDFYIKLRATQDPNFPITTR